MVAHAQTLANDPNAYRREHSEMTHYARSRHQNQLGTMQPIAHPMVAERDLMRGKGHRVQGFLAPHGQQQSARRAWNKRAPARGSAHSPPPGLKRQPRVQTPMYPGEYRGPACTYVPCGPLQKQESVKHSAAVHSGVCKASEELQFFDNGQLLNTFDSHCGRDGQMSNTFSQSYRPKLHTALPLSDPVRETLRSHSSMI